MGSNSPSDRDARSQLAAPQVADPEQELHAPG